MSTEREKMALPIGSEIGDYRIVELLGSWGFCLSYLAEPKGGGERMFLHELLPEELAFRNSQGRVEGRNERNQESLNWARDRFLMEHRALAACGHPNITRIREVFEANGTAYVLAHYEDGRTVKRWLKEMGRAPTEAELQNIFLPVLDALQMVHARGLLHLNIKPETIQLTPDGLPLLANFAGARQAIAEHTLAASAVTPGYSPPEQYDAQKPAGAWSDFYGLAAVMHRAIAGHPPPEATLRLKSDPYEKLALRFSGKYSELFLAGLDGALAPDGAARPQSAPEWLRMLGHRKSHPAIAATRAHPYAAASAVLLLLAALAFALRPHPIPIKDDQDKTRITQKDQTDAETEKTEREKAREKETGKAEAEKKETDRKEAEKVKAEKADESKKAELEAANKEAEQKEAAKMEVARKEAEKAEAARKEAVRKKAEMEAARMDAAKKEAARMEAEKAEAARKEAERKQAEMEAAKTAAAKSEAARKETERIDAAKKEAERKKKEMETAKGDNNTPPPPDEGGYVSSMLCGVWEASADGTHGARRLEIKEDKSYVISGGESDQGVVNALSGQISFRSSPSSIVYVETYKMRGLGELTIDGPVGKGQWKRVRKPATPVP